MLTILSGDCRDTLKTLPDKSVNCCVTSPPYFNLRDYGNAAQIGAEPTPAAYVAELVAVFREVRRVLRDDGTVWLNLGDSYAGSGKGANADGTVTAAGKQATHKGTTLGRFVKCDIDLPPKNLIGIPWRVAFALQDDGWILRSDIIWHKPNPMPESVTDRCTKAHEYVFLLAKSERYFYDAAAIAEPANHAGKVVSLGAKSMSAGQARGAGVVASGNGLADSYTVVDSRNRRDVWTIPSAPYSGAHFATMPPALARLCILAGCPVGGTVIDPFGGSGTTAKVAIELGRRAILCELNPDYIQLAEQRTTTTIGLPF